MRTLVSAIAVLIGLCLAAVAVPAVWVDRNIVREDGFVALTGPLGKDPTFQKRLADATVSNVASGDQIPDFLMALAQPVLDAVAGSLTDLPGYPAAWTETLRRSHRLTFADPTTLPPEVDATTLTLDIAPLVGLLAKQISDATALPVEAPDQVLLNIGETSQRQVIDTTAAYAPMGYALAIGAGIAMVIAFVAARRRRSVLAWAGAGVLLVAGLWKLGSDAVAGAVTSTSSGDAVAETFKNEFVAAATASFDQWILAAAVAGAAGLGVALVARLLSGRTARPAGRDREHLPLRGRKDGRQHR